MSTISVREKNELNTAEQQAMSFIKQNIEVERELTAGATSMPYSDVLRVKNKKKAVVKELKKSMNKYHRLGGLKTAEELRIVITRG